MIAPLIWSVSAQLYIARSSLLQQDIDNYYSSCRQLVALVNGGQQHFFFVRVLDVFFSIIAISLSRLVGCNSDYERGLYFGGALKIRNSHSFVVK